MSSPPPFNPLVPTAPPVVGNSSLIGYVRSAIQTAGSIPFSGQNLDNLMQQVVAGIVSLPPDLIKPRYQAEPPPLPSTTDANGNIIAANWASIGCTNFEPVGLPASTELSTPTNNGSSLQQDWEYFTLLCSFYGPSADRNCLLMRQGIFVAQNRQALQLLSIGLIRTSGRRRVPVLIKQKYLERYDMTIEFMREVRETYPILYFLSTPISVTTDTGVVIQEG